jgi:hypothetical protein
MVKSQQPQGITRNLNQYLWDNIDERIPKEDYRRLSGWIKDKETRPGARRAGSRISTRRSRTRTSIDLD